MRKFLVLVVLSGLLAVAGPVSPVDAEGLLVTDSGGDGVNHGDANSLQIAHGSSSLVLGLVVSAGEDPATAPNWTNAESDTHIEFNIDTNGSGAEEFYALYASDSQGIFADVFRASDDGHACAATPDFSTPPSKYEIDIPRSCLGSPASVRVNARISYDPTPGSGTDTSVDSVPDTGFSPSVAADAATIDRPVRVGVVGRGDSGLYVSPGFGEGFGAFGGQLIAGPAIGRVAGAAPADPAEPIYIGTGVDNQLWARTGGLGWRPLSSGGTFCKGGPGAIVYKSGETQHLVVACRGSDDALWSATAPVTQNTVPNLTNWTRVGGILTAGPALGISQHLGDVVTYLVRGTDGAVWQSTGAGFSRTNWLCKGHAAFNTLNDVSWFGCRGTDDALWVAKNTPAGWGPTTTLGGILAEGPGVAVTPENAVFFVPGIDNAVWQRVVRNSDGAPVTGFTTTGGQIKYGVNAVTL